MFAKSHERIFVEAQAMRRKHFHSLISRNGKTYVSETSVGPGPSSWGLLQVESLVHLSALHSGFVNFRYFTSSSPTSSLGAERAMSPSQRDDFETATAGKRPRASVQGIGRQGRPGVKSQWQTSQNENGMQLEDVTQLSVTGNATIKVLRAGLMCLAR